MRVFVEQDRAEGGMRCSNCHESFALGDAVHDRVYRREPIGPADFPALRPSDIVGEMCEWAEPVCASCHAATAQEGLTTYGQLCDECGVESVVTWATDEPLWNFVVAGQTETVMKVRLGAASGKLGVRSEGVAGLLCPDCFTRRARERGLTLVWKAEIL